jgi:hypothetical protein
LGDVATIYADKVADGLKKGALAAETSLEQVQKNILDGSGTARVWMDKLPWNPLEALGVPSAAGSGDGGGAAAVVQVEEGGAGAGAAVDRAAAHTADAASTTMHTVLGWTDKAIANVRELKEEVKKQIPNAPAEVADNTGAEGAGAAADADADVDVQDASSAPADVAANAVVAAACDVADPTPAVVATNESNLRFKRIVGGTARFNDE